jgi:hypothetical protein
MAHQRVKDAAGRYVQDLYRTGGKGLAAVLELFRIGTGP